MRKDGSTERRRDRRTDISKVTGAFRDYANAPNLLRIGQSYSKQIYDCAYDVYSLHLYHTVKINSSRRGRRLYHTSCTNSYHLQVLGQYLFNKWVKRKGINCTFVQALMFCTGRTVKCTLVQALRLCTGRTAHRRSRVIALPFHDHSTSRWWGGQLHAPAALYLRERPSTHCTGGWVDPRAGLDRCGKSNHPHRNSIPGPSRP
jgi:hypothetical protein